MKPRPEGDPPLVPGRLEAALWRAWVAGWRLARIRRALAPAFPLPPLRLAGRDDALQERLDALLFRMGATLAALLEDAMEPLLLAGEALCLPGCARENLLDLQVCGAIASAGAVLAIRERVQSHHRIAALEPGARAAALAAARADSQALIALLAGLCRHVRDKGYALELTPFEDGLPGGGGSSRTC